ncbi:unnamed protein product [Phytophthora lilii]|uniref:Unnamed protein product n=1 Tax=Phytophthora lilii TaxID=2077276 RepID=A0A9W6TNH1_9STRA|nr:unnamed protein product [Phytophthora lilii]
MDVGDDQLELVALPPLSPTMELAFSEALEDLSELDKGEEPAVIKLETPVVQNWKSDADLMSLRMATPPPSALRNHVDMSPSDKDVKGINDSAEAKRARRTAIEKKSRQRRQEMLKRMQEEVMQLENVYAEIVKRKAGGEERRDTRRYDSTPLSSASMDELQRKYTELSLVAHALEQDQTALRELLQGHKLFQQAVKLFADEKEAEQAVWNSGIPPSSSFSVQFRPLSPAKCSNFVRQTYQEIEQFCEIDNFESTGANFMGWTDKRKVDHELKVLQFCFTKQFPLENAEHLLMQTWNIFSNGSKMAEMSFDNSVRTRFEVLQILNDNLIIIRRDHKIPSMPMTFVSVQLIFRLETPTGYTMCSRTIPAPKIQQAMEPHEYFYDAFHWYDVCLSGYVFCSLVII